MTNLTRRELLANALSVGAGVAGGLSFTLPARAQPRADVLIIGQNPDPLALCSAGSIDGGTLAVSAPLFDRLFVQSAAGQIEPQLALSCDTSRDGLVATLKLRPGVTWHDGKPFTSEDVACSLLEVWKKHHARSTMAYANLVGVDTPEPGVVALRFSKPVPYLLSALSDGASQVVPAHLYKNTTVLSNPANSRPVGTGPYRFAAWERGNHVQLERNPRYWNGNRPYLDGIIFKSLGDAATLVAALETGSIHYAGANLAVADIERLRKQPGLKVQPNNAAFTPTLAGFAFNLNRPALRDVRVRQAFAHAIDRQFILRNIYQGYGELADSAVIPGTPFHSDDVPHYAFDLKKAAALLDAAGLRPDSHGVRLTLTNDIMPPNAHHQRSAQFIRATLARIGVKLQLRSASLGEYLNRVFTRRDWDTITYSTGYDADPALGLQRFYWSKTIQPGVPFTNATHYSTPQVDQLLEAAQIEMDVTRRRQLYAQVQRIVQTDLPTIPILYPQPISVFNRRLSGILAYRADNYSGARLSTG